MPTFNPTVQGVGLTADNRLRVVGTVSSTGFDRGTYTGSISVADSPQSDFEEVSGQMVPGAQTEHEVLLNAGLTEGDLPAEVLVTFALNTGDQDQVTVSIEPDTPPASPQPPDGVLDQLPVSPTVTGLAALVILVGLLVVVTA